MLATASKYYRQSPDKITIEQLKGYLHYCTKEKGLSVSTLNQTINAFRILFQDVLGINWETIKIKRPRKNKHLPVILSKEEVSKMIEVTDAGAIIIDGKPSSDKRKNLIGVIPQEISVYQDLTCRENLHFFAKIYGLQGTNKSIRINDLIQIFNLAEYENTKVNKLSGGWRRRVNIAVALVHFPTIVIMDEPTAGLDVEARHELW